MSIEWAIHLAILGVCSIQDLREQKVSIWKVCIYAGLAVSGSIWNIIQIQGAIPEWLLGRAEGSILGISLLLIGKISHEAIGYGDAIIVWILGFGMGFWKCLEIFLMALVGVFLTAICICITGQRKRNREIPFLPFLFIGTVVEYLWIIK